MITGEYEKLEGLAKYNQCAEHKTPLEVAWLGEQKTYVLRCDEDHFPDTVVRIPTLSEDYRQGAVLDPAIKQTMERKEAKRVRAESKQSTAITMGGIKAVDLATGELLLPEVLKELVKYARFYGLDPGRSHVVMMYGQPYVTLDGYLYHADQQDKPYKLTSRPLSEEERKSYQIVGMDHAWVADVEFPTSGGSFTGLGIVTEEEMAARGKKDATKLRSPVVAAHPWQMAQKRAEWQALRRAFPIGESPPKEEE